jgi:7-cyano-7-deazaguanine synthase
MSHVISATTENKVDLWAPFLYWDKAQIAQIGIELSVPFHLTRTCYKNSPVSCGRCGSCVERLMAFEANDVEDPLIYEDREFYKTLEEVK